MNSHEMLAQLRTPDTGANENGATRASARRFGELPHQPIRPLGEFSDFICEELGSQNQLVHEKSLTGPELFMLAEQKFDKVSDATIDGLFEAARRPERQVALLDLLWMLRSLDIAHSDDVTYRDRKRGSRLFGLAQAFADMEGRHPALSWSDISIYHPVFDPRTFLGPSSARDEEVLMYATQCAMEQIHKRILEQTWSELTPSMLSDLVRDLDASLKGLIHYSRSRTIGQFYQLDPFLGPNNEYRGHATGSFSAWSFLIGIFLSGNYSFARRLTDEANRKGFDRDADPYIDQVIAGTFKSLDYYVEHARLTPEERVRADALYSEAMHTFTLFLHSHKGAIKRHAKASFEDPSPTDPVQTNAETIKEAIGDMSMSGVRR